MSEQEQYKEWKAMPLSERMRSEIAMASAYANDVAALEAKLEAMRNAAAIAIVALAHYSTSDNELDNVREMLEGAVAAAQEEKE